jgi:FkbM family methyltransferase
MANQRSRLSGVFNFFGAGKLWFSHHILYGRNLPGLWSARFRNSSYRLYFRPSGSDPEVIWQVFARRDYDIVKSLEKVEYIIDCGANIGCTTYMLLSHFAHAQAIVVEPDQSNMALCRKNLGIFGKRVKFVEAAVWNTNGPLVIERSGFRDGLEWSIHVRNADDGEVGDISGVTIDQLITDASFPRVDLIKMDIEGAEATVFDSHAGSWLCNTRSLVIEFHGEQCEARVLKAMSGLHYRRTESDEVSFFEITHRRLD